MRASPVHEKKRTPKIPARQFENWTDGDDECLEVFTKKAKENAANSIVYLVFYECSGRVGLGRAELNCDTCFFLQGIPVVHKMIFLYETTISNPAARKQPFYEGLRKWERNTMTVITIGKPASYSLETTL